MVLLAELVFVVVVTAVGVRWYLRTPMHRARKSSGAFPSQVAGHGGFGMYSPRIRPAAPRPARLPERVQAHRRVRRGRHAVAGQTTASG